MDVKLRGDAAAVDVDSQQHVGARREELAERADRGGGSVARAAERDLLTTTAEGR